MAELMAGGAIFALVCIFALRFRSGCKMGVVALFFPLLLLGMGYYRTYALSSAQVKRPKTAAECSTLHPMLRLALWLVFLEDRRMALNDMARY